MRHNFFFIFYNKQLDKLLNILFIKVFQLKSFATATNIFRCHLRERERETKQKTLNKMLFWSETENSIGVVGICFIYIYILELILITF